MTHSNVKDKLYNMEQQKKNYWMCLDTVLAKTSESLVASVKARCSSSRLVWASDCGHNNTPWGGGEGWKQKHIIHFIQHMCYFFFVLSIYVNEILFSMENICTWSNFIVNGYVRTDGVSEQEREQKIFDGNDFWWRMTSVAWWWHGSFFRVKIELVHAHICHSWHVKLNLSDKISTTLL